MKKYDAIVVGAGPNGLAAAIALAQAGRSVLVREAAAVAGGGMRSEELTLPGFTHDVFSTAHPLAAASPFFRGLPLEEYGLEWVHSPAELAHPLESGTVLLYRSVERTAAGLGSDAERYLAWMGPLARRWPELMDEVLGPLLHLPRHLSRLGLLARFGRDAIVPARALARGKFQGEPARALLAGIAAHSATPLDWMGSGAVGMMLMLAGHAEGWPIVRGGSRRLAGAMVSYLRSLGGEIETGAPVGSLSELPEAAAYLLDLTPRQILRVAGARLPEGYRRRLGRYRYGPGVYKMDWALSGPIPWRDPRCAEAITVHLGGTLEELVESESKPARGVPPEKPFVLLCQPSLFDPSRAPAGKHTAWAYCHVPNGSGEDMTARIEERIERFAPGFRERVLARSALGPADLERRNANLIGGDISGGSVRLSQMLFRPAARLSPYRTPNPSIFICSSSTPPGPGVHGMCGYRAALAAMR